MSDKESNKTGDQNNEEETKQRLIDSLLESAIGSAHEEAQSKVTDALSRIETLEPGEAGKEQNKVTLNQRQSWFSRRKLIGFATAAAVMIAVGLPFMAQGQSALNILQLSLKESKRDVARRYDVELKFQKSNGQTNTRVADLYVKGSDRFAFRRKGLLGREWWIGGEGDNNWVVPAVGPVIEGDPSSLSRWLKRKPELSTPYLHVSTILERMGNGYKLTNHREETITGLDGTEVRCRHIEGRLRKVIDVRDFEDRIPDRIELWADVETGVAYKVVASWDLDSDQAGRLSITAQLVDQPELPGDWFQAEGHYQGQRRRISFNTKEL